VTLACGSTDIGAAIRKAADGRRFTTNVERVLFALVANRAIEPMSKLSAAEWVREDAAITSLPSMDDDQAYRAMDLLAEADTTWAVQEAVFFAVANLLNLEVGLLFFDTVPPAHTSSGTRKKTARTGSAVTASPRLTVMTCRRS
jgi:hypothetical protein